MRYVVYDVFTETRFGGNQLAVIPEAAGLPEAALQAIAREFNFSETTFVYPSEGPDHTARMRIFTPGSEMPFAGHPTIGTAVALHALGAPAEQVLMMGVGPIPCSVTGTSARFTTTVPLTRSHVLDVEVVAACLGLAPEQITTARHVPEVGSVGLPFALVELSDPGALAEARPITDAFRTAAARYPLDLDFAVYAYLRDGQDIQSRMFAPLDGIPEDPATGSAAAALAAYLGENDGRSGAFAITQGEQMGRPSRIDAAVTVADGRSQSVTIGGTAIKTMEGRLVGF